MIIQFCEAGIGYGESTCGVHASASTKLLIKGGTVVNAQHQEVADVYVEDGIIVAVKPNIRVYSVLTTLFSTSHFLFADVFPFTWKELVVVS